MPLNNKIKEYINQLADEGLLRNRELSRVDNSSVIHFDCNDYLSLAYDKRLSKAYQRGYALYPTGSGASMLLSGYHANHRAVEQEFAKVLNVDDCILFSSGYAANLAVSALLGKLNVDCYIDKESHASIYDGLSLSQVKIVRYLHNDVEDLCRKMSKSSVGDSALITEGVFSMSGQFAPLNAISAMGHTHQSTLIVDEAHSFGVVGEQGRGAVVFHGLTQNEVPLRIIPLGKAFAAQGAIVAGCAQWIHALLQAGRSLIYSTAISPAMSYGFLRTLEIIIEAEDRRAKLLQLIDVFRLLIKKSPLNWSDSKSPIQQLQLGCPHLALYYSKELKKQGISCFAIRKPTVSTKASGLRIVLNYDHTPEQIYTLFEKINTLYESTHTKIW